MIGLHSARKEQREAVRQLLTKVLLRDMGTFRADGFKFWVKDIDDQFRKIGMTLRFEIRQSVVHFAIKDLRTGRVMYNFASSTRVRFEARDVVMDYESRLAR